MKWPNVKNLNQILHFWNLWAKGFQTVYRLSKLVDILEEALMEPSTEHTKITDIWKCFTFTLTITGVAEIVATLLVIAISKLSFPRVHLQICCGTVMCVATITSSFIDSKVCAARIVALWINDYTPELVQIRGHSMVWWQWSQDQLLHVPKWLRFINFKSPNQSYKMFLARFCTKHSDNVLSRSFWGWFQLECG